MICRAVILLATVSVVFSHYSPIFECARQYKKCISGEILPILTEFNCAWEHNICTEGRIYMRTQCNCDCPGSMLCCDPSILEEWDYPIWRGSAPICTASCRGCGNEPLSCWWQSSCGNGAPCWTGNKYLCGIRRRNNFWPFLDKTVSSLLQWMLHTRIFQSCYIIN